MFAALALQPQRFTKVPLFVALAPVTKLIDSPSEGLQSMAKNYDIIDDTCYILDIHEFLSRNWPQSLMMDKLCKKESNIC
jgi:hypothetical protein